MMNDLFIDSKYTNWYYSIVCRNKNVNKQIYTEKHHIIPKCMGGPNKKDNIVRLTAKEHFICHWILTKICIDPIHKKKMFYALNRLSNSKNVYSSLEYSVARKKHSDNMTNSHPWKTNNEVIDKLSKTIKSHWNNNPNRKIDVSRKFQLNWDTNYEFMKNIVVNNLPSPMIGKDNPATIEIEYYGQIYYGWRELKESTSISKHLYKKYYLNGLDPICRIGSNGPIKRKENRCG